MVRVQRLDAAADGWHNDVVAEVGVTQFPSASVRSLLIYSHIVF
jgi:hypothetical protein